MSDATGDPLAFLDLEQIDGDIFRGRSGRWPNDRRNIYGGETAAQALRAAAHTVEPDRVPHSLHGYFLRPGDPNAPVVFMVDRDRDGRSFSARRVAGSSEFVQPPQPGMRAPEECPPLAWSWCPILDIHVPPRPDGGFARDDSVDRVWTRINVPVPDVPILHACLHVFASDVGAGFGDLDVEGIPPGGPSIDHALWFQHPSRADDWVIWDCEPAKVGGHRGLYTGTAHDLDGNLVAMIAQEMLLRAPRR
jgi:acyl-CoA thioesterase II